MWLTKSLIQDAKEIQEILVSESYRSDLLRLFLGLREEARQALFMYMCVWTQTLLIYKRFAVAS